jgi:hypothetical protein
MQGIYTYIPETNNVPREYIIIIIIIIITKIAIFFTEIVGRVLEFVCLQYAHTLYVALFRKKKPPFS